MASFLARLGMTRKCLEGVNHLEGEVSPCKKPKSVCYSLLTMIQL